MFYLRLSRKFHSSLTSNSRGKDKDDYPLREMRQSRIKLFKTHILYKDVQIKVTNSSCQPVSQFGKAYSHHIPL